MENLFLILDENLILNWIFFLHANAAVLFFFVFHLCFYVACISRKQYHTDTSSIWTYHPLTKDGIWLDIFVSENNLFENKVNFH